MSRLGDRRHRHDGFHQRAKREGFAARSVFKLEEIQDKFRVLRARARVLDLGCRPGSWMQYSARIVGVDGKLVGLDRQPLAVTIPGARIVVGDVMQITAAELRGELDGFDVVLSDMAPDTSGIRSLDQDRSEALFERALEIAEETLVPGGNFVGKLFQGRDFKTLIDRCRKGFAEVATPKPKSSRKESIELYVVACGRR